MEANPESQINIQKELPLRLIKVTSFLKALTLSMLIIFPIVAFYLGTYYSQSKSPVEDKQITKTNTLTNNARDNFQTPAQESCEELSWQSDKNLPAEQTSSGFLLYRHTHNFQTYYQFEISDKWAAYTDFNKVDNTTRTNFGPSHFWYQQENTVLDIPVVAYVTFGCSKKLISIDPSKWSYIDYGKYFSSKDINQKFTEIDLGGIKARKYLIQSQSGEDANIYFTQGNMIFVIVVRGADENTVNHIISTFKLFNKP